MNKLFFIVDLSNIKFFIGYKSLIDDFSRELGIINFLDISKILKKENLSNKKIDKFSNNIIQPNSYEELKVFLKQNKNLIYFYGISNNLEYFKINYYLSKFQIKTFLVSNLGYNPISFNISYKKNFIRNFNIFFKLRFKVYYLRILSIFGLTPKIDYFFEASNFIYQSVQEGLSNKLKKTLPFFDFSYYKKIIKINSKHFDAVFYSKYKTSEKYIVFIDGIIDHKDRIIREGQVSDSIKKKYFTNLRLVLNNYKKIFNKEIIVCLHPKNNVIDTDYNFKDFKCVKYETEKYISEAFVVFFHESSAIIQAIAQKKRIVSLYGDVMGEYINNRCKMYSSILKTHKINLDNPQLENNSDIIKKINNSINGYDEYSKMNIVNDPSKSGIIQVIEYLNLSS
tara:strand:+ start:10199 stop:11386 length:1188 start_codon:yes stop_codon:yes gene_type:complete